MRVSIKVFFGTVSGLEIGFTPRHDTVTFVISDGETETLALCCDEETPTRSRGSTRLRESLPIYDLHITVLPVDSQPPSLATGGLKKMGFRVTLELTCEIMPKLHVY